LYVVVGTVLCWDAGAAVLSALELLHQGYLVLSSVLQFYGALQHQG
jgi:hypothetical protein